MYSVNFNEEEKKKRRKAGDSAFADGGSDALQGSSVPFMPEEDEASVPPFNGGGLGKGEVFGKTLYASSFGGDKDSSAPASPFAAGGDAPAKPKLQAPVISISISLCSIRL